MKCNNIHIIGIAEGEQQGTESLFEKVIMENFPNLVREKVTQIQESPSQSRGTQRGPLQTHHNENGKIPRQRENLKGSKGETGSKIQGSLDKVRS